MLKSAKNLAWLLKDSSKKLLRFNRLAREASAYVRVVDVEYVRAWRGKRARARPAWEAVEIAHFKAKLVALYVLCILYHLARKKWMCEKYIFHDLVRYLLLLITHVEQNETIAVTIIITNNNNFITHHGHDWLP